MIGARVLTVVAILLALVGMLAFYVEHTALDEADAVGLDQDALAGVDVADAAHDHSCGVDVPAVEAGLRRRDAGPAHGLR